MAGREWFVARGGEQDGPFPDEQLRAFIASGAVTPETLVWCDGMSAWAKAGAIPGLMPASRRPPGMPVDAATHQDHPGNSLSANVDVWPLFGRVLLLGLCQIVVIPLPWAVPHFLRWFVDHIELPQGQRAAFVGKPGDIWWVFILYALSGYASLYSNYLQLLAIPLSAFLLLLIARWFFANLVREGSAGPLKFTGEYLPMLGWMVLLQVSVLTIIGWAWVTTAWTRWGCKNVVGGTRQLIFSATAWNYLWRTLVFGLTAILIIPIPWMLRWYTRWIVSQFALM